jgi:RNA polymerase sigma factor (sigma-70 family)
MTAGRLDDVMRHVRRLAADPGGEATDGQLLARYAAARDEGAFRALIARHGPMVLGVCRRLLRDPHRADDAFQATFLLLVQKAAAIARPESLGNWLYGVAYRVAARARRQDAALPTFPAPDDLPAPTPDEGPTWLELRPLLDAEIARLRERYRRAVVLCYFEGHTCEEAARLLGCAAGTVKSRLARARDLLRRRLTHHVPALSAGAVATALAPERLLAAVPADLLADTIRSAVRLAAGETLTACGCSAGAAALTNGVLRTMTTTRIKLAAALALLLGILGAGAGILLDRVHAGRDNRPAAGKPPDQPKAPEQPQKKADRQGEPLPAGAVARLGTVRMRHGGTVTAVAFAPGGGKVTSASADGTLRVWDAATGKELARFGDHQADVRCVAYSADGRLLASGGDDCAARIRDAATGKERLVIDAHPAPVRHVAFSPDGRVLATASGDAVRLWTAASGRLLHTLTDPDAAKGPGPAPAGVVLLGFSPDGGTVFTAGPGSRVSMWDAASGKAKRRFETGARLAAAAVSRDGATVALAAWAERPQTVRLWDVAAEKAVRALKSPDGISALAFSPDGKHLVGSALAKGLRVWEVASGKELLAIDNVSDPAHAVAFAPDGKTVAAGVGPHVRLWELRGGKERLPSADWPGIVALALSRDGKRIALGCRDQTIRVVDRATGAEVARCDGERFGEPAAVAFLPDGKTVVSVSEAGWPLRFWDAVSGKETRRAGGERDRFTANPPLAVSPDGRTIALRSQSTALYLYDVAGGKARQLTGHGVGRWPLAFSPDGKTLASAERGDTVRLWDVASGDKGRSFTGPYLWPVALAFSPDGKRLASASYRPLGGVLHVWDVATGKLIRQIGKGGLDALRPDQTEVKGWHGVAFAGGGKLLLAADEATVRVWDLDTGEERSVFRGHEARVTALATAAEGRLVATAGDDRTVVFWDPEARVGVKADAPAGEAVQVPLEARLVAKKGTFPPPKGLLAKDSDEPLRFHAVDLVLELHNTGKRDMKLRLSLRPPASDVERRAGATDGWLGLRLELKGPVAQVGQLGAGVGGRLDEQKLITLAAGERHLFPIKSLTYPSKDGNALNYFLCLPGEYTVRAVFETVVSPAPPGAKGAGMGFGHVTLRSNTVKLKCAAGK